MPVKDVVGVVKVVGKVATRSVPSGREGTTRSSSLSKSGRHDGCQVLELARRAFGKGYDVIAFCLTFWCIGRGLRHSWECIGRGTQTERLGDDLCRQDGWLL